MLSKKFSCDWFSFGIWRKMTFRYWPLWAGYLAIWMLIGPQMLDWSYYEPEHVVGSLDPALFSYSRNLITSLNGASVGIALYAGLVAMAVYSYLYQSRSVNLFHALPVRRETLFVTNFITGLSFIVGPNLILTGYFALLGLMGVGCEVGALLTWFAVTTLVAVFFFGLATLCATVTGTVLMVPVLYGIFNFLVVAVESMLRWLASMFLWGVTGGEPTYLKWSPIAYIFGNGLENNRAECYEYGDVGMYIQSYVRFTDWGYVLLLGLAGLLFAGLALWLYRRWQSESAGDLMAFGFLRPVFTYAWAAGCSLMLGSLFFVLLGEGSILGWFFGYDGANLSGFPSAGGSVVFALCMLMGGTVGYFSALMLHRKSFRVFRKRDWRGYGAFVLALLAVVLCIKTDLFGIESWTPDAEQIENLQMEGDWLEETEFAAAVRLHKAILSNRTELERQLELGGENEKTYFRSMRFRYQLKDGREVIRQYTLPINRTLAADPTTPTGMLYAMMETPEKRLERLGLDKLTQPISAKVYFYYTPDDGGMVDYWMEITEKDDLQALLDALKKDATEGTLGSEWIFDELGDKYDLGDFWAESTLFGPGGQEVFVTVAGNAPNAMQVLKSLLKEHLQATKPELDLEDILAGVK